MAKTIPRLRRNLLTRQNNMPLKQIGGGRSPRNRRSGRARPTFDKATADRFRFECLGQGLFSLPDAYNGRRCWIEWEPSSALLGPDRRFFYSKKGVSDRDRILGSDGHQLPRGGGSLDPAGRVFLSLGSGALHLWALQDDTTTVMQVTPRHAVPARRPSEPSRVDGGLAVQSSSRDRSHSRGATGSGSEHRSRGYD